MNLYKHQLDAIKRYKDKDVIPLFFSMGTGKTATSLGIAAEKYKSKAIDALLVIAPNDVHKQWQQEEIPKWLDYFKVDFEAKIVGGRGGDKELTDFFFKPFEALRIVCVNIDTFSQPSKWKGVVEWANLNRTMIILDEATCIKNPKSKRSERLLYSFNNVKRHGKAIVTSVKKSPGIRCVLTGTPVTNGPMDLWAIMEFLQPNYFGRNWFAFKSYFLMSTKLYLPGVARETNIPLTEEKWRLIKACSSFDEAQQLYGVTDDTYLTIKHQMSYSGPYKRINEIKAMLDEDAMFVKIEDCVDMPQQLYLQRRVSLSPSQQRAYKEMCKTLKTRFNGVEMTAASKLASLTRLQEISSGFIIGQNLEDDEIAEDGYDVDDRTVMWLDAVNPKIEALTSDIAESEKPVIVITRFTAEAQKLYDILRKEYRVCVHTGWKKVGSIDAFKRGEYDVLIANIAAIARGFNLQNSCTILFYANTYSMELRSQAECRTYRLGQTKKCVYIDYIASDSDELMLKAIEGKKNILDYITGHELFGGD